VCSYPPFSTPRRFGRHWLRFEKRLSQNLENNFHLFLEFPKAKLVGNFFHWPNLHKNEREKWQHFEIDYTPLKASHTIVRRGWKSGARKSFSLRSSCCYSSVNVRLENFGSSVAAVACSTGGVPSLTASELPESKTPSVLQQWGDGGSKTVFCSLMGFVLRAPNSLFTTEFKTRTGKVVGCRMVLGLSNNALSVPEREG